MPDSEDELLDKTALLSDEDRDVTDNEATPPRFSRIKRACVRLSIISVALMIAIAVPHFGLYMGFVGNFTGMCLAFIFPCLFYMKLKKPEMCESIVHCTIIAFGSVSAGLGMYYSTKELIDAYSEAD